jgi:alginate O-acetyltransferase complex protein AlgI
VLTEITDINDVGAGRVLYDGDCALCTRLARRVGPRLQHHGFQLVPLQSREAAAVSGASQEQLLREVHVVVGTPEARRVLRGAEAVLHVAPFIPWLRPLTWLAHVPGAMPLMRIGYRFIAEYRHCADGVCSLRRPGIDAWRWLPPLLLVLVSLGVATCALKPWWCMWTVALGIYFACKWITWWPHRGGAPVSMQLAYLFAWPGMDPRAFLEPRAKAPAAPTPRRWLKPTGTAALGTMLLLLAAHRMPTDWPLTRAWLGLAGLVMLLHFGALDLIVLAWRRAGIEAEPLMNSPARSRSLGEFWGRRWNTGFVHLSREFVFVPARRHFGAVAATIITFLASGLIHDAVISIPARGGYGLPTLYFAIQYLGLLIERMPIARRAGLGRGIPAGSTRPR